MIREIEMPWVILGYHIFATKGPDNIKVEPLAKDIGKNKSSFYHLFSDVNEFKSLLLKHHIDQAKVLVQKEINCHTKDELIHILMEHKIDLLFNRQLRIHRENTEFNNCFVKATEITNPAVTGIWAEILGLKNNIFLAELIYKITVENFLLQFSEQNMSYEWISKYFDELIGLVLAFKTNTSN